ncbi:MAG: hypothetical protein IKN87_02480 [Bacilli bacterium]|nr:hypothetical protein [Bacilli bacterium]
MKKLNEYIDVKAAIITLVGIGLFLFLVSRCNSIGSDSTIIKKTQEYISGERFELISSEKYKESDNGKIFYFRSLERDLNFEMVVTNESDIINPGLIIYKCTYYNEINKIYESQVIEAIEKYFDDSKYRIQKSSGGLVISYVFDEAIDIWIEISGKSDIDNYARLVNELNKIYSAENKYNGIHGVEIYATTGKEYEIISQLEITGKTKDQSTNIINEINNNLDRKNITLE